MKYLPYIGVGAAYAAFFFIVAFALRRRALACCMPAAPVYRPFDVGPLPATQPSTTISPITQQEAQTTVAPLNNQYILK